MRVFLSYHTPDRAIALALKDAIEKALPGSDVFVDQTHLRHGHLWQPALFEAIGTANAFITLVSNRLGDWQKIEYYEARDRKARDEAFILLPVVIADRNKGPAANLPGLAQLHWIESTEPAAPEPAARIVAALQSKELPKPAEPWRAINPYRGLVALDEQDADFFFGRDRETGEIVNNMIAHPGRFLALVGNSGVGKSSLVQAGVIGALKRQRWPGGRHDWPVALADSRAWAYLTMRPGEDPVGALASEFAALWFPDATDPQRIERRNEWRRILRDGTGRFADLLETTDKRFSDALALAAPPRVFLYIDQGEELYARSPAADRKRFSEIVAEGLTQCPDRLIAMTSQRSDYYGGLQGNKALFGLAEKIDVEPLDGDALAQVLREPARVLGAGFETDDLVGHVVRSAEDQAGALPLLADLFTDLWERMQQRGDGFVRISDRRDIIQVGAALAKRADTFLERHADKSDIARRLFTLRLAHVPRQGEPVRVRWQRDAQGNKDGDAEWALAELLAGPDWRLLVTGEKDGMATAEVAHEVLLKTWPKLKRWLEEEREFLVWKGETEARCEEWVRSGRREGDLLMGLALDRALAQKAMHEHAVGSRQGELAHYIDASRAYREGEQARERTRRRITVLSLLAVALLSATSAALLGQLLLAKQQLADFTVAGIRNLEEKGWTIDQKVVEETEALAKSRGAIVGSKQFQDFRSLQQLVAISKSVLKLTDKNGTPRCSSILVRASDLTSRLGDETLLMTTAHCLDEQFGGIGLENARVAIERDGSDVYVPIRDTVWLSPVEDLDAILVRLKDSADIPSPIRFVNSFSGEELIGRKAVVIGFPQGGPLSISVEAGSGAIVDVGPKVPNTENLFVHYRTATMPGVGGGPVLVEGQLVAMHHAGGMAGPGLPRLGGKPGTHEANEGILVASIARALHKHLEHRR